MVRSYRGVVLVTVDSLRADHMGCYGYERDTTPFLDDFARSSLLFENATSAGPRTSSSFPCLLSSSYLSSYPYGRNREERLSKERLLISEYLEDKVKTAGFHSNPLLSKYYGYDRGFDRFEDYLITDSTKKAGKLGKLKRVMELLFGKPPFTPGEQINRDALEWMDSVDGKFFTWIHYMEPHMPYLPPSSYLDKIGVDRINHFKKLWLGKKLDNSGQRKDIDEKEVELLVDLYDACIRYVDDIIKELVKSLPEDVALIFTADHGEAFREHGFLAHQDYLYDEVIHIPMIVSERNGKDETPVGHVDAVPTALDLLDEEIPEKYVGESLLDPPKREGMFTEWVGGEKQQTAYRGRDFKYILDGKRGREEFYDLGKDPEEQDDISSSVDLVKYRKAVLEHKEKQKRRRSESEKRKIDEKIKDISI